MLIPTPRISAAEEAQFERNLLMTNSKFLKVTGGYLEIKKNADEVYLLVFTDENSKKNYQVNDLQFLKQSSYDFRESLLITHEYNFDFLMQHDAKKYCFMLWRTVLKNRGFTSDRQYIKTLIENVCFENNFIITIHNYDEDEIVTVYGDEKELERFKNVVLLKIVGIDEDENKMLLDDCLVLTRSVEGLTQYKLNL